jgi:hypothetical protein
MPPVRFRLRLREFLLLVMLAALVAAGFAIRARTADLEVAHGHAARAYRVRVEAKYLAERIEFARRKLEMAPTLSEDWAAECNLRLIPSVIEAGDMPAEGKDLVVVAESYDSLWFRVFDGAGNRVVDHVESDHPGLRAFKQELARLRPPHELTRSEKALVIAAVSMFVNDYRATLQAGIRGEQVRHTEALADAERLERLSRRP